MRSSTPPAREPFLLSTPGHLYRSKSSLPPKVSLLQALTLRRLLQFNPEWTEGHTLGSSCLSFFDTDENKSYTVHISSALGNGSTVDVCIRLTFCTERRPDGWLVETRICKTLSEIRRSRGSTSHRSLITF